MDEKPETKVLKVDLVGTVAQHVYATVVVRVPAEATDEQVEGAAEEMRRCAEWEDGNYDPQEDEYVDDPFVDVFDDYEGAADCTLVLKDGRLVLAPEPGAAGAEEGGGGTT